MRQHQFAVGEPIAYAEDGKRKVWVGGYEIVRLLPAGVWEPRYEIRNADQSYDQVVEEHELCKDLGARVRGE